MDASHGCYSIGCKLSSRTELSFIGSGKIVGVNNLIDDLKAALLLIIFKKWLDRYLHLSRVTVLFEAIEGVVTAEIHRVELYFSGGPRAILARLTVLVLERLALAVNFHQPTYLTFYSF